MISIVKITIVQTIHYMYNCLEFKGTDVLKKGCILMNKKEELMQRIEKLSEEQFELLISLFAQQEQEFVRAFQSGHPSSPQSSE